MRVLWNDDGKLSIKAKKIMIYIISMILTFVVIIIAYKYCLNNNEGVEAYMAVLAVMLTVIGYIISITHDVISQQMNSKFSLFLDVDINGKYARIRCFVENKGNKRINPNSFYLFIDQPLLDSDSGIYQQNHILKHDCKQNCKLSDLCRKDSVDEFEREFTISRCEQGYFSYKKLDLISSDSILYINPGESFSEDVIIKLKKGVYRVLVIGNYDKNGCVCANQQFVIR